MKERFLRIGLAKEKLEEGNSAVVNNHITNEKLYSCCLMFT